MKIFYGPKGTGKTKAIIDSANSFIETAKGHIVFITDTNRNTHDIKYQIRLLDVKRFGISGVDGLNGFVKGIVAANSDNEFIYIDGIARITKTPLAGLEKFFALVEKLEKDFDVNFIFTCSCDKDELPAFVKKYVD
jgi:hypothetical protein